MAEHPGESKFCGVLISGGATFIHPEPVDLGQVCDDSDLDPGEE